MDYRQKINSVLSKRHNKEEARVNKQSELEVVLSDIAENGEKQEIARKSAITVQSNLAANLSGIVTRALAAVYEEDIEFVAQFVERRGVSECDVYIRIGENMYDPLNGHGGGIADICSICLQMAFIIMSDVSRTLIVDEPIRHTDAVAQERFAAVLRELCKELNFTIIMVTHAQPLIECADRVFTITKEGERSYVNYSEVTHN